MRALLQENAKETPSAGQTRQTKQTKQNKQSKQRLGQGSKQGDSERVLSGSMQAIWAARRAHAELPLRLCEGSAVMPFRRRRERKEMAVPENEISQPEVPKLFEAGFKQKRTKQTLT